MEIPMPDSLAKLRCYRLRIPDAGGDTWCLIGPDGVGPIIQDELEQMEVGDLLTLEPIEMTQKEIDALPEFGGW